MRGTVIVSVALLSFVSAGWLPVMDLDLDINLPQWVFFKQIHKKIFQSIEEELEHLKLFKRRIQKINKHNKLYKEGKVLFKKSINKFTDIAQSEFARFTHGFISSLVEPNTATTSKNAFRAVTPQSVDWRQRGIVSPVKDQETCASCWSFAAAGAIEAQDQIQTGKNIDLSEQQLVDCAPSNYNAGCMGGHPLYAFNYTKENRGLSLRMYYPYENVQGDCRYKKVFNSGTYSVGYNRIPSRDEESLKEAVALIGPVASAMDGTLDSLRDYAGGIYYDEDCDPDNLTHAVLIIGYGSQNGTDYWLIKNSLGKYWGEGGYLKLARNKNNHCGIATDASYPIIENISKKLEQ